MIQKTKNAIHYGYVNSLKPGHTFFRLEMGNGDKVSLEKLNPEMMKFETQATVQIKNVKKPIIMLPNCFSC